MWVAYERSVSNNTTLLSPLANACIWVNIHDIHGVGLHNTVRKQSKTSQQEKARQGEAPGQVCKPRVFSNEVDDEPGTYPMERL